MLKVTVMNLIRLEDGAVIAPATPLKLPLADSALSSDDNEVFLIFTIVEDSKNEDPDAHHLGWRDDVHEPAELRKFFVQLPSGHEITASVRCLRIINISTSLMLSYSSNLLPCCITTGMQGTRTCVLTFVRVKAGSST
jgi:hypothetical protein